MCILSEAVRKRYMTITYSVKQNLREHQKRHRQHQGLWKNMLSLSRSAISGDYKLLEMCRYQMLIWIYLVASEKFLISLIHASMISSKLKHRQKNRKFNWHWKEFVQEQWPCKRVTN